MQCPGKRLSRALLNWAERSFFRSITVLFGSSPHLGKCSCLLSMLLCLLALISCSDGRVPISTSREDIEQAMHVIERIGDDGSVAIWTQPRRVMRMVANDESVALVTSYLKNIEFVRYVSSNTWLFGRRLATLFLIDTSKNYTNVGFISDANKEVITRELNFQKGRCGYLSLRGRGLGIYAAVVYYVGDSAKAIAGKLRTCVLRSLLLVNISGVMEHIPDDFSVGAALALVRSFYKCAQKEGSGYEFLGFHVIGRANAHPSVACARRELELS